MAGLNPNDLASPQGAGRTIYLHMIGEFKLRCGDPAAALP